MNNKIEKKIAMDDFNLSQEMIKHDLLKYYNYFNKKQKGILLKRYKSVEDYINILYCFRFVKKLDYNEMAELLGIHISNVYEVFSQLGLGYPGTFEENEIQHIKTLNKLRIVKEKLRNINIDIILKNQTDNESQRQKIIDNITQMYFKKGIRSMYNKYGFKSFEQYVDAFYYLIKIEKLTTGEIALLFNCSRMTIVKKLKQLGLNRSISEAQLNIKERNRRDTDRILRTGRNTTLKRIKQVTLFGSNLENVIRSELDNILPYYIDIKKYEIIVGLNSKNIISPKEVDIPIIIVDENTIYKIAIEVNGSHAHKSDDFEKIAMLNSRGWKYYSIWITGGVTEKINFESIREQMELLCNNIKKELSI
jgi:hypothetical protein